MPIIKLNAIDSTNDYLKQLSKESDVENYTIVMAEEQTKGKGQMGAKWVSEKGKNLTMSMLLKNNSFDDEKIFNLNIAVALSVFKTLKFFTIPNISIKWPNDILSDSKKVAGILIENILKPDGSFTAVVGIGLNVNQTDFKQLPQATSLACITGKNYALDQLGLSIRENIISCMELLTQNPESLWQDYHSNLYKINYPSAFEDQRGNRFMGIIQKVSKEGKLEVRLDDGRLVHYEVKEVKMLY